MATHNLRKELDEIWHDVLLNQFHDVLPGTSIKMVNDDVHEINDRRIAQTSKLLETTIAQLLPGSHAMNGEVQPEQDIIILDPLRTPRLQVITLNRSIADAVQSAQHLSDDLSVVLIQNDSSGLGGIVTDISSAAPSAERIGEAHVLRNDHISLTIANGRITSLRDKDLKRELILPGPGAQTAGLMIYDDLPLAYDAWDAEIYHLDRPTQLAFDHVEVAASGPLRATLKTTTAFGASKITLLVSDNSRRIADYSSRSTQSRMAPSGTVFKFKFWLTGTKPTSS